MATFWLLLYGVCVALVVGMPLAVWSAVRRDRWADQVIRLFSTTAFGMPTFWLGLVLALVFGLELGWLPVGGYTNSFPGIFVSLTLPAITLGLSLMAIVIRTLRSSLLEVLSSEYVEAARARGLSERRVVVRYGAAELLGAHDHRDRRQHRLPDRRHRRHRDGVSDPGPGLSPGGICAAARLHAGHGPDASWPASQSWRSASSPTSSTPMLDPRVRLG